MRLVWCERVCVCVCVFVCVCLCVHSLQSSHRSHPGIQCLHSALERDSLMRMMIVALAGERDLCIPGG